MGRLIVRSRAPLRLGLGGGGTDISDYFERFGGAVLNATISLYAYATLEPTESGPITVRSVDRGTEDVFDPTRPPEADVTSLVEGLCRSLARRFGVSDRPFTLTTSVDAPPGSGLGSSSTLAVAIVGAFVEWLNLPLGEYDISHLAYEIERLELRMAGGKQDQYAATFGGFNYMEFYAGDKVIVNPLRVREDYVNELQFNLLLYYTGTSRLSSRIIEAQAHNARSAGTSLEAMHQLKDYAVAAKEAILTGRLNDVGHILRAAWEFKKQTTDLVTNPAIDEIYEAGLRAGATGGKMAGAGGGGFMMFYCPGDSRYRVIEALAKYGGEFRRYHFSEGGLRTWKASD